MELSCDVGLEEAEDASSATFHMSVKAMTACEAPRINTSVVGVDGWQARRADVIDEGSMCVLSCVDLRIPDRQLPGLQPFAGACLAARREMGFASCTPTPRTQR